MQLFIQGLFLSFVLSSCAAIPMLAPAVEEVIEDVVEAEEAKHPAPIPPPVAK